MSGENDPVQRTASPLNSGRSSPNPLKARQRDEDNLLKKDKGYRRYASTVERVLSQFDTAVEEWADYITFLGRLLKALSVKPSGFTEIPHKFLVAKRLSQCLNPILPSGVHQKTIEVYSYVFSTLGKEGLSADLGLYLPGLSPILSFAALSVKPNVLTVFETYIVPLRSTALRPALKSILLALLPGLEEENSDEFDRTLRILEALKTSIARDVVSVGQEDDGNAAYDQYFWQCMFLASITSTTRRPGALAYLIRNLPQLGNAGVANARKSMTNGTSGGISLTSQLRDAINSVITPEPGLLIRCFCAGLQDDRPLIQRGFLDLLVTHLPLNSAVLQEKVKPEDLQILVLAATSVVARKDMSLNRRLWSWFLGPEINTDLNGGPASPRDAEVSSPTQDNIAYQTHHFEKFGLRPLVEGISAMVARESDSPVERTKALRICLSLMDRWEIGGLVVPKIFLPAMRNVWLYQSRSVSQENKNEVLRSANMFFDGVESSLIWSEICEIIARAISPDIESTVEACSMLEMVYFMITSFNIREEEMQTIHMPLIILMIVVHLQKNIEESSVSLVFGKASSVSYALKIALKLFELVPQRAVAGAVSNITIKSPQIASTVSIQSILSAIYIFYQENKGNIDVGRPFSEQAVGQQILNYSFSLTTKLIALHAADSYTELEQITTLLKTSIKKSAHTAPNMEEFMDILLAGFNDVENKIDTLSQPFAATAAKVAVIEGIFSTPESSTWIPLQVLRSVLPSVIHELWPALSASRPKSNVEAVRALWTLYTVCEQQELIESSIATLMVQTVNGTEATINEENARRFTTLWAHVQTITSSMGSKQTGSLRSKPAKEPNPAPTSVETLLERPLLLLLDCLDDPNSSLFPFVVGWVQSLPSLDPIFDLLVARLSALYPITTALMVNLTPSNDIQDDDPDGLHLCYYYLRMTYNVIQHANDNVWEALGARSPLAAQHETILNHQDFLIEVSLKLLQNRRGYLDLDSDSKFRLSQVSLALIREFYDGPLSGPLVARTLEEPLIVELSKTIEYGEYVLQNSLMEVILAALRPRYEKNASVKAARHQRTSSKDNITPTSPTLPNNDGNDGKTSHALIIPPAALLDCILLGLKSPNNRPVLESWTAFAGQCLPLYKEGIFQILLPLVGCFCDTLEVLLQKIDAAYKDAQVQVTEILDPTITILLNGLEQLLATSHEILTTTEATVPAPKSPEPQQTGFFGSMVGAFAADSNKPKALTANNRLTVLLCFKDAMKICYSIWAWGDSSRDPSGLDGSAITSFRWITLRLRNRTRRIFEHLFAEEVLECLETLIELWQQSVKLDDHSKSEVVISLLIALESSRPKVTMPALFNAIYSRTNPSALESNRTSTLTSDLSDVSLATFLVTYIRALDDDTMDEIWNDCIIFLKDVLANPMPHRQTLPSLIEFTAVLGEKVDNTTFGEQRKLRRELGDLFIRLLTATLAIRPMGSSPEVIGLEKQGDSTGGASNRDARSTTSEGLVSVLATIAPGLSKVLPETDRIGSVASTISSQVVAVMLRAKPFPENISKRTLDLIHTLLNLPEASRFIKKDINDAFNDPRFFSASLSLVINGWQQVLQSWSLADKDKMPEQLSRLVSPAAAGVLGIGANSARLDADKKTQLTLRRMAMLILSAAKDTYVINLSQIQEKLVDLLHATATSSPSSITRAEIYILIRALVLRFSPTHLSPFWPTIHTELYEALSLAYPTAEATDPPNPTCLLQACKLLDTLLVLGIDDFQMQEWLFISDTTDAIYPTEASVALVTDLAQALDEQPEPRAGIDTSAITISSGNAGSSDMKQPLLTTDVCKGVPKDEIVDRLVRPFFRQLSIYAFESTYRLQTVDEEACFRELLVDLFNDSTLV